VLQPISKLNQQRAELSHKDRLETVSRDREEVPDRGGNAHDKAQALRTPINK